MNSYRALTRQRFMDGGFSIVPIRFEDRLEIMKWRNQQIYHLRQEKPLTPDDQERYFTNVVRKLFDVEKPAQLLFSFLKDGKCIGYGGLVHINWIDKHAEISFIMATDLEHDHFDENWSAFLGLIERVAFDELQLHKVTTYAYDLRPHLYPVLERNQYFMEARLKDHCFFDEAFVDVVLHAKFEPGLRFVIPTMEDAQLYFDWANDPAVRNNSYSTEQINYESHVHWFKARLSDDTCYLYLFMNDADEPVGQVRIQRDNELEALIGVSADVNHRGKGYAHQMIAMASSHFLEKNPRCTINAYIKTENAASARAFEKAGYSLKEIAPYEDSPSFHYIRSKHENSSL